MALRSGKCSWFMKLRLFTHTCLLLAGFCFGANLYAQAQPLDIAKAHMRAHYDEWGLTLADISDFMVSDMYTDHKTGITRVYLMQQYNGIPVYNAINNFNIDKEGKVFYVGKRFVPRLAERINTTIPVLSAEEAVHRVAEHLGLTLGQLSLKERPAQNTYLFDAGTWARQDIEVKLRYQPMGSNGPVLLAWDVTFFPKGNDDMWSIRVDAVNGQLLDKANWTVYCRVDGTAFRHIDDDCENEAHTFHQAVSSPTATFGSEPIYNVWPVPYESPNHGPRTLVIDPADPEASPFGWHDTDGVDGAEFTITRGLSVHAYEDRDGDGESLGNEPDGGADLHFDFPYDPTWEPEQIVDAATVNLFFWNNVMHDFAWHYGFDEAAGNFQAINYTGQGQGNDYVRARAQQGAETGNSNNANFGTPPDGGNGTMNMYIWTTSGARYLQVTAPVVIAGKYSTGVAGTGWGTGAYVTDTPVSGEVALMLDDFDQPTDACDSLINKPELAGKIAMVDRGGCQFGWKAYQAQQAGAIGVIICNHLDDIINLGAGTHGGLVEIPVVSISFSDCQKIRQFIGNGLEVTLVNPGAIPAALDGDLDNGIIAHEYGHGISNRLTGGPSQAGCLNNDEQMGEGWSDWFSLVTSVLPGDTGDKKRGIGTFALREGTNGTGIRRYPYSTDMTINPLVYSDVAANTEVHALGEVWTAMIWDLYWAFVDQYGFDPDLYNGSGGNNMAIRLVFEGMKNQPCNPGFIDGRDAILAADQALYGGANECLIWDVFARRGAGWSASQGDSDSATDQVEAFDTKPACRNAITITKSVTDFIQPGDDIEVFIEVGNFKHATATNVKVTDELPEGTSFKAGSANVPATVSGNTVTFDLGNMAFEETKTITYALQTSPDKYSIRKFLDDIPNPDAELNYLYYVDPQTPNADKLWIINDVFSHSPEYAWLIENSTNESRVSLQLAEPKLIEGEFPVLRFYHMFDTETGVDGGIVEIKEPTTSKWELVQGKVLRGDYTGVIPYSTSFIIPVPKLYAFTGSTNNEFISTYVDLRDWVGKELDIRFRFGTDDNGNVGQLGWVVDDIELMDLFYYNSQACVTTNEGDLECAEAPNYGTIVDSRLFSATVEKLQDVSLAVYPNPAKNTLHLAVQSEQPQELMAELITIDGRTVMSRKLSVFGNDVQQLDIRSVPSGFYFLRLSNEKGVLTQKVIIE